MADISQITLPSGNTYQIKDTVARQMAGAGIQLVMSWNGQYDPSTYLNNIPAGAEITWQGTTYTGAMVADASLMGKIYLVYDSGTTTEEENDDYIEYVVIMHGDGDRYEWEILGSTKISLADLGALAYKDNVLLNKGSKVNVLGSTTSASAQASAVSFDNKDLKTAITGLQHGVGKFIKGNVAEVSTNTEVSIPNVTSAGAASNWAFNVANETLTISGGNGSAPTLGTQLKASKIETQSAEVMTGFTSDPVEVGDSPEFMTNLTITGTANVLGQNASATAAAQTITLNKDNVGVADYDNLSVSVQ